MADRQIDTDKTGWKSAVRSGFFADARVFAPCRLPFSILHCNPNVAMLGTDPHGSASRLASVSDGNGDSAAYSHLANSPLAGQIAFAQSGATRMTTIKQYDYLNRLSSVSSPSNAFAYSYNAANQRTQAALMDGSSWRYQYDALGQVTSGNKYWADGTLVAGQQFDYAFDTIGNRTQTQAGGDQTGANLRAANYTNNTLNQITSRDAPGAVDVMGLGFATNAVTVNGQTAYRKGEYFREQLSVANGTAASWTNITVAESSQGSVSGHLYVAQTPENYTYDADGNLLSDGRWTYAWDAENRLVSLTSLASAPAGSQLQLTFAYDYQGRRIQKTVLTWNGTSWIVSGSATNYAYDGWNCIAALNSSQGLVDSYLWGSDLSGSLQGAGGVGGLIQVTYYGAITTNCFVAFDGNGNVSALVNAANGATVANYEYGPFGELIRATGPAAKLNPFRFSTKFYDDETDLVYYDYRYYNPSTGRWLSRDPIDELSFRHNYVKSLSLKDRYAMSLSPPDGNEFAFVQNDPEDKFDVLGLCPAGTCDEWTINVIVMRGGGAEVMGLDVRTTLTASPKCCIDPKSQYYRYLGYGLGAGADWSVNFKVGSHTFTTACIPWKAHNGIGRVTGAGGGIIRTYGITYFTTPQAYFSITSWSWGFDVSIFTTAGYWWVAGN